MKKNKTATKVICFVVITLFTVWTIVPIFLMLSQSIKPDLIMFANPPQFVFEPTLKHFNTIFTRNNILENMLNSLIIGGATMALCLVMGAMCAYTLARIRVPGVRAIMVLVLVVRMVPVSALMMPMYVLIRGIGLSGTHLAVVLAHTTINLPFATMMMRGFFAEVPLEVEQASQVDGCSRFRTFLSICVPLAAPGLATAGIMVLLNSWNEFMFALILSGRATRTLPVGISAFLGSVSIDWGASSAAAALAVVPIFIAGIFIQKYFVRGLTGGAVKG